MHMLMVNFPLALAVSLFCLVKSDVVFPDSDDWIEPSPDQDLAPKSNSEEIVIGLRSSLHNIHHLRKKIVRPLSVKIVGPALGPVSSGHWVEFRCRVNGSTPPFQITWWKENNQINDTNSPVRNGDRKRVGSIRLMPERSDNGLTIRCQAHNPDIPLSNMDDDEDSRELIVHYKPEVSLDIGPPIDADQIKEGDDVYFECSAAANPPVHSVKWYLDENLLEANISGGLNISGHNLVLKKIGRERAGHYTCSSHNQEGHGLSNGVDLNVIYKPEVSLEIGRPIDSDQIKEGDDVYFECSAAANPPVHSVKWYLNGTLLDANKSSGLIISGHNLTLQKVGREQAGKYTCLAHNQEGEGLSNGVDLNVMYNLQVNAYNTNSIEIASREASPGKEGVNKQPLEQLPTETEASPGKASILGNNSWLIFLTVVVLVMET